MKQSHKMYRTPFISLVFMRIRNLTGCIIFLLIVSSYAARVETSLDYIEIKNKEIMPPEEEKKWLQQYEAAMKSGLWNERWKVICDLWTRIEVEGDFQFMMRYQNPKIIRKVGELYQYEYEQRVLTEKMEADNLPIPADIEDTCCWYGGEGGMDYRDMLAMLAESSFNPEIYDTVICFPQESGYRVEYLSRINPEKTLQKIFTAQVGKKGSEKKCPNYIYLKDYETTEAFEMEESFTIIKEILKKHPDLGVTHKKKIVDYVKANGKNYRDKPDDGYAKGHDYRTRQEALNVLMLVGTEEDLPIVQILAENAPVLTKEELNNAIHIENRVPFPELVRNATKNLKAKKKDK